MTDTHLISEAEHRGYLEFNQERTRVTYICARRKTEDYTDPEEEVRAWVYSWLIIDRGYPASRIDIEVLVPRRTPSDWADIVVYEDAKRTQPFLVVETKKEASSLAEWTRGIEQGFGNANSLRTTDYLLIDRGAESILFDVQNFPPTERVSNRLGARQALAANYGQASQFRFVAGSTDDIKAVPPSYIETRVRRAHAAIWAGGKRDPLTAFDEWSKLLFAKIWDERHTPNGQPRQFQVAAGETIAQAATRIRNRYADARRADTTIFQDDRINLPDDKIVEVVGLVSDIGFTLCDVDALGAAFEHFFSSVFRGDLGQYFTRRELVRFVCGMLRPTDNDFVLDPTAGSGGFLLEALMQTWHFIDESYAGQPDVDRRKIDFALHQLFGIEIHATLSRVCKTNLVIHKDGHTNIEGERSCLDARFANPNLHPDGTVFSLVIGNPPFGDEIREGDRDRLGESSLSDFEISHGLNQISSELLIIERSLQFLTPGGRLGMVVPDGLLNNSGEISRCPQFRRFLLANTIIEAVVSLPDFAFRKAGAQNKTSVLFLRKMLPDEKRAFDANYDSHLKDALQSGAVLSRDDEIAALRHALQSMPYQLFMAEVEQIGYTPAGGYTPRNELYREADLKIDYEAADTVLGQYGEFLSNPRHYLGTDVPLCRSLDVLTVIDGHSSLRLDPKFHLFRLQQVTTPPPHLKEYRLGELLKRREEEVNPEWSPDQEFLTLTLSQDGTLSLREAGKGNNPPSWHGAYFSKGSRWYRAHTGDLIISQIDLWKGCVAVIPSVFDGAIVTQEFPLYEVRP